MKSRDIASSISSLLDDFFLIQKDISKVRNVYAIIMKEVEIAVIKKVMKLTNGNKMKGAQILGISRNTLSLKIKNLGLDE